MWKRTWINHKLEHKDVQKRHSTKIWFLIVLVKENMPKFLKQNILFFVHAGVDPRVKENTGKKQKIISVYGI